MGEIAHDLNNALTSILGYGELIAEDARTSKVNVEDADRLVAAAREAIRLVRALRA